MERFAATLADAASPLTLLVDYDYQAAAPHLRRAEALTIHAACVGEADIWDVLAPHWQDELEQQAWAEARHRHGVYVGLAA
ncbi:hypothetical protein SAMN02745857_03868 [Andreprevotia lacus DSM 23236]|jgi:hypothetical protein|uniref:Uncharacterized protein n=1 Tax=Andreprevotia lacus DSM 23236 TaxID=1121001 RepID=A0A1W1Y111_9NEIS|nr:hypothetical protein [Andreprevotia lacus]SMC29481.1 hypothetical protein SAMN02745857_03868 [Andreprevotia lacus DSM 23236]